MNDILEYIEEDLCENGEDFNGLDGLSGGYICYIWRNAPERMDREPLQSAILISTHTPLAGRDRYRTPGRRRKPRRCHKPGCCR